MHVPEIIQQAVAGALKFSFIESTITALGSGTLSSQKGTGSSEALHGRFRYVFHPRTSLQPAWLEPQGYLDPGARAADIEFSIKGTERGGAQWFAKTPGLRQVTEVPGRMAIEADVEEWWCTDARSVKTPFVRGIVPGTRLYPVDFRKTGGARGSGATVDIRNMKIEFRDHGNYTEILAQGSGGAFPPGFLDEVVSALGSVNGRPVQLVYKEEHIDNQRRMCLRSLDRSLPAVGDADEGAGFWQRYREHLLQRLEPA